MPNPLAPVILTVIFFSNLQNLKKGLRNGFDQHTRYVFHLDIANLVGTSDWYLGEHHRKQRKLLNPVFSIAHMRGMGTSNLRFNTSSFRLSFSIVPTFYEIANKVCLYAFKLYTLGIIPGADCEA